MARRNRRRNREEDLDELHETILAASSAERPNRRPRLDIDDLVEALTRINHNNDTRRRKDLKAPSYEGSTDVELFLKQFNDIAIANDWTETETILHLRNNLNGKASECSRGETKQEIYDALRCQFGISKSQARERLEGIKKKSGQTYLELANTITRYVNLGYPNMPITDRQDLALDKFSKSTNDLDLRRHLKVLAPENISEAVKAAQEFTDLGTKSMVTSLTEQKDPILETLKAVQAAIQQNTELCQQVQTIAQQAQLQAAQAQAQATQAQTQITHMGTQPLSMTTPRFHHTQNKARPRRPIECYTCKGPHRQKDCPTHLEMTKQQNIVTPSSSQSTAGNFQGPTQ